MITYYTLPIEKTESFDELTNHINAAYIDNTVVNFIKDNLKFTKCTSIVIEFPYYDSDYLSSYYPYYSKKHRSIPKECYRLLFFADTKRDNLMGYITLRPTYDETHIGRVYFDPKYIVKESSHIITADNKVHISGAEAYLNMFPQLGQDNEFCVCAHVSTWEILRHYSNKFRRYPEITLGSLSEKIEWNNRTPFPFYGLTPSQITDVFRKLGYSPLLIFEDVDKHDLFMEKLYAYLDSGIPIVGGMINKEHAITLIGYNYKQLDALTKIPNGWYADYEDNGGKGKKIKTNIAISNYFRGSLIVNDDNTFPYKEVKSASMEGDKYSICDINYIIVPLYDRITLLYEHVRRSLLELAVDSDWKKWTKKYIARIFLTSANTYREYISANRKKIGDDMYNIIARMNMPKLIWCIELSTFEHYKCGEIDHVVLLDSTSSRLANDKCIFIGGEGLATFRDCGQEKLIKVPESMGIKRFEGNLTEVL